MSKSEDKYLDFLRDNVPFHEGIFTSLKCGRECNKILPPGNDISWTKGSIIGGLIGGPWGYLYGQARPAESLQKLCRNICRLQVLEKEGANPIEIIKTKEKIKALRKVVEKWIQKFENSEPEKAKKLRDRMNMLLRHKFEVG